MPIITITQDTINCEDVKQMSDQMYNFYLFKTIGYLFTLILIIIRTIYNQNLLIATIPLLLSEFIILLHLFFFHLKSSKHLMTFAIIECFIDIAFKICIIICIKNDYYKIYSCIIIIIHLTLNFVSMQNNARLKVVFFPPLFMINILYYMNMICLFLKFDLLMSFNILACLWPFHLFLLFLLIYIIVRSIEFYSSTKKLLSISCKSLANCKIFLFLDFQENFFYLSSLIFLSTSIYCIYLIKNIDNSFSSNEIYVVLMRASIPLVFCLSIEVIYMILAKKKIKNCIKEFFYYKEINRVNVEYEENRISTNVISREQNVIDGNQLQNDIVKKEEIRNKKNLKKYISKGITKHVLRKTSCFYIPCKNIVNRNDNALPKKINRRAISQMINSQSEKINDKDKNKKISQRNSLNNFSKFGNEKKNNFSNKCIMCCENDSNAVIMKCGHGGTCYDCSIKLLKNGNVCHICRKTINEVLKISNENEKGLYSIVSATISLNNEKMKQYKYDYENNLINQNKDSYSEDEKNSSEQIDISLSIIDV